MKFNNQKVKEIRKKKSLSLVSVARMSGISRGTLWLWEKGDIVPAANKTRLLARALKVSVSEISDLEDEIPKTTGELKDYSEAWNFFADADREAQFKRFDSFIDSISSLRRTLKQAYVIIDAILDSSEFMFYLKDTNQKYITANALFLANCSLNRKIKVLGCDDSKFFNIREAKINSEEDENILISGQEIRREGYIPGSKRKKWGMISKKPVFNQFGKIAGIKGSFLDITYRKEAERTRELLELNISFMDVGVSITDFEKKKVIYINKAYAEIFGIEQERIYKDGYKAVGPLIHPDDRKDILSINFFPDDDLPYKRVEFRICGKNNAVKWVESSRAYKNFQGKKCILSISKDITELKKLQALGDNLREKTKTINELEDYISDNNNLPESSKRHIQSLLNKLL